MAERAVALLLDGTPPADGKTLADMLPFFLYVQRVCKGEERSSVAIGRFVVAVLRNYAAGPDAARRVLGRFAGDDPVSLQKACEFAADASLTSGALVALAEQVVNSTITNEQRLRCLAAVIQAAEALDGQADHKETLERLRSMRDQLGVPVSER